jgi:predicted permease
MIGDRLRGLLKQTRALVSKEAVERELDDEIRFHVEREAERLSRLEGLDSTEARRRALVALGGVEPTKERVRQARWTRWPEDIGRDVQYGLRSLRKRWGMTTAAVVVLAVGIGASAIIYDVVRALATDAVPFPDPDRLVTVSLRNERGQGLAASLYGLQTWLQGSAGSVALAGYTSDEFFVGGDGETFRVQGARITHGFFDALGVTALRGRLSPADDTESEAVAIITERFWASRFGSEASVVGRSVRIDGTAHTVIGIVPSGQQFPPAADVWIPLGRSTADDSLRVTVLGRLVTGATTTEAEAALATMQRGLDRERPQEERASRLVVEPLSGRPGGDDLIALVLLQCSVLVLLLITSANAAGLMLARAIERRRELAVRTSLGAGRGRLVRQVFVESALLAASAGLLGLGLAQVGILLLRNAVPDSISRGMLSWERFGLDGNTIVVAMVVMPALTGVMIAILPALRAVRGDLTIHLRDDAPTATYGRRGSRLSRLLLSAEVAMSMTLLLIAALLTRSLTTQLRSDPGFDAEGVLAVEWAASPDENRAANVARFQHQLLEQLAALPEIDAAAIGSTLPMSRRWSTRQYRLTESDPDADPYHANWRSITASYLGTLNIPLLAGRRFQESDDESAATVAIISESMASRHWPDGSALGRQIEVDARTWTVIGVAGDVHDAGAQRRAAPTIYIPQAQSPGTTGYLAVRASGNPADVAQRVRQEMLSIRSDMAIGDIRTLPDMVREYYAGERLMVQLMAAFAFASLLITVVSLYALAAHAVIRRRREIGIRLALGAFPRQILAGVMVQAFASVVGGITFGMLLAAGAAQMLGGMLYGVRPIDPLAFTLLPASVLAVAVVASLVPSLRATKVDPTRALRVG